MRGVYLGIDQSKRSTGITMLDEEGLFVASLLISEPKLDNEDLMLHQWYSFKHWLGEVIGDRSSIKGALIEGLSFGSVGGAKDFLAGLQWNFRCNFRDGLNTFLGTVPVTMWRSKVLSKEEQKEAKALGKDGLKKAVFNKLSPTLQELFTMQAKEFGKKDSIYDLADSFFIAKHCYNLSTDR